MCGQAAGGGAGGVSSKVRCVAPRSSSRASTSVQSSSRAKPCPGAVLSVACGPNHGKQMGTPPRIGFVASHALFRLIQSTGSWPWGCHAVTCAPCR